MRFEHKGFFAALAHAGEFPGLPIGWDRRPSAAARTKRQAGGQHQLGKLGYLWAVAGLTWGGAATRAYQPATWSPPFPVVPRTIWHGFGTTSSSRTLGWAAIKEAWAGQSVVDDC